MRILYAEDEVALARAVAKILEKNNYTVDVVHNGLDALDYLQNGNYDIAILDIMMPKMDGITLLRRLRTTGITIPIIMLTAKTEIDDKVLGLDSGANDYLTKPFDTKELLARIRVLTRGQRPVDSTIQFGNISLDRTTFALSSPSGSFRLANKEFQMMEILMSNPKILISSEQFMEKIWGYDANAEINVVWVYISYLRKKLNALHADIQIKSTRNAGYTLEEIT
ncbi:MAG: response regulator transcription factor [Oscillospiraceae bacterium]|nr:response regulator transcription factor [Oscillospiraceae bacterium]